VGFAVDKVAMGRGSLLAFRYFRQLSLQQCSVFTFIHLLSAVYGTDTNSVAKYTTASGGYNTKERVDFRLLPRC
jgi:hypothetical protein